MAGRLSVEVIGLPAAQAELREAVQKYARSIATELVQDLKDATPVRTGRARSGWTKSVSNRDITIENRVPYVPYLERGTRRMRAANSGRGIIGPALQQSKGKFK
jgi:fumarate hydratase class II